MKSKVLILFLIFSVIFCQLAVFATAVSTESVNAQIDQVYGGRKGVVTMTFDDGKYDVALTIDELLEKYNLTATMMLIASKVQGDADKWRTLFESGRMVPQNHSMNHIGMRDTVDSDAPNLNAETYKTEIVDSKALLESLFPEYDMITYAVPNGRWCDDAATVALTENYMMRYSYGGVQSLDPGFAFNKNGNWSALRCVNINTRTKPNQLAEVKSQVDEAAQGAWICTLAHYVGNMSQAELTYDEADELFAYISNYEKSGVLWVTDTASATKYIRERQNTTLAAKKVGSNISLTATLAEKTQDGLVLDKEIFDYPLTVKVEVDANCNKVYYLDGCVQKSVDTFTEGSKRYARVEIVPNGEELVLYPEEQSIETLPHDYAAATCNTPATCKKCGYTTDTILAHDFADATCDKPKTCILCQATEGNALGHDYADATCTTPKTCNVCGKTSGNTARHDYISATCTEPRTCRTCGEQTGSPLGHNNDKTTCADTLCSQCNQMIPSTSLHSFAPATCTEAKTCTKCGLIDGDALGHAVNTSNTCANLLCSRCKTLVPGEMAHEYADATCTQPKTCIHCSSVDGMALGHTPVIEGTGAPDTHKSSCTTCQEVINATEPHTDSDSNGLCDGCGAAIPKNDDTNNGVNSTVITVIVIGGVVAIAGVSSIIIIRKKRGK